MKCGYGSVYLCYTGNVVMVVYICVLQEMYLR